MYMIVTVPTHHTDLTTIHLLFVAWSVAVLCWYNYLCRMYSCVCVRAHICIYAAAYCCSKLSYTNTTSYITADLVMECSLRVKGAPLPGVDGCICSQ